MKIADLNQKVFIQKLKMASSFFDEAVSVEEEFPIYCHVMDKGVTETDTNGHAHEARELLVTMRSFKKTRAICPDLYQLKYRNELYDIAHVELDSAISRYVTVHARRKNHASHRPASSA